MCISDVAYICMYIYIYIYIYIYMDIGICIRRFARIVVVVHETRTKNNKGTGKKERRENF